jgi:hypothetical protein
VDRTAITCLEEVERLLHDLADRVGQLAVRWLIELARRDSEWTAEDEGRLVRVRDRFSTILTSAGALLAQASRRAEIGDDRAAVLRSYEQLPDANGCLFGRSLEVMNCWMGALAASGSNTSRAALDALDALSEHQTRWREVRELIRGDLANQNAASQQPPAIVLTVAPRDARTLSHADGSAQVEQIAQQPGVEVVSVDAAPRPQKRPAHRPKKSDKDVTKVRAACLELDRIRQMLASIGGPATWDDVLNAYYRAHGVRLKHETVRTWKRRYPNPPDRASEAA